jgi:hypothetical protein
MVCERCGCNTDDVQDVMPKFEDWWDEWIITDQEQMTQGICPQCVTPDDIAARTEAQVAGLRKVLGDEKVAEILGEDDAEETA